MVVVVVITVVVVPQEVHVKPLHEHHWWRQLGTTLGTSACSVTVMGLCVPLLCELHLLCSSLAALALKKKCLPNGVYEYMFI